MTLGSEAWVQLSSTTYLRVIQLEMLRFNQQIHFQTSYVLTSPVVLQLLLFILPAKGGIKFEFSVFISHVIKTKNRNRSINKFKNLGYDR